MVEGEVCGLSIQRVFVLGFAEDVEMVTRNGIECHLGTERSWDGVFDEECPLVGRRCGGGCEDLYQLSWWMERSLDGGVDERSVVCRECWEGRELFHQLSLW